jgi:hypothetical protein
MIKIIKYSIYAVQLSYSAGALHALCVDNSTYTVFKMSWQTKETINKIFAAWRTTKFVYGRTQTRLNSMLKGCLDNF